jgi:hypothetical protein
MDDFPGFESSSVRCWMLDARYHKVDPLVYDSKGKVEGSMHKVMVE